MAQSGPLWSLYPLLAIIALCEFFCGVVHLLFCLPLYFLCLPLFNGVFGLLASFHAIFLRYPNRCDFYLQSIGSFTSFVFFFSSLVETYCVGDFSGLFQILSQNDLKYLGLVEANANMKEGVCYGLKYRTISSAESCLDFLGPLQMSFLTKIGWEAKDRESIRFFITASLSVLSGIHLFCTTGLMVYSATETKVRLYSYHYQLVVGVLILLYIFLPWVTLCHWSVLYNSRQVPNSKIFNKDRDIDRVVFSSKCKRIQVNMPPESITRHCHWLPDNEEYCLRVIHFSHPYIDWQPKETEREIAVLQIVIYIFLLAFSFLQFVFSMKSAFTTKLIELYY
ncbi:unnamed protein product [Strongylus vulgaris]|uniref:Uncharacterized protein n=1 Tax=Strongylus vulgaris TaxID=40348 RepID=A0A3P7J8N8_STRVU|nr:unnamed protein product [Strongylus vulgaris]